MTKINNYHTIIFEIVLTIWIFISNKNVFIWYKIVIIFLNNIDSIFQKDVYWTLNKEYDIFPPCTIIVYTIYVLNYTIFTRKNYTHLDIYQFIFIFLIPYPIKVFPEYFNLADTEECIGMEIINYFFHKNILLFRLAVDFFLFLIFFIICKISCTYYYYQFKGK